MTPPVRSRRAPAPTALALVALALVALAVACTRSAPPAVAPVEIAIPPMGDAGAGTAVTDRAPPPSECRARLRTERIQTGASCILDEQVSHGPGLLLYPCSGDGPATAIFGEHRFEGAASGGRFTLELTTELDWDDGCHWETSQRIVGDLRSLTWSYGERPVSGGTGGKCFGACTATAGIRAHVEGDGTSGDDGDDDDIEDEDDLD